MRMAGARRRLSLRRGIALLIALSLALLGIGISSAPAVAGNPPVITGIVQDGSSGQGVSGLNIELFSASDLTTPVATASTNGVGAYVFINVNDGTYLIEVPPAQGYNTFTTGQFTVSGSNVSMPNIYVSQVGALSGTVSNYDGTSPITVTALLWNGSSWDTSGTPSSVNADGSYSVDGVHAAGKYAIEFDPASYSVPYLTTFYGTGTTQPDPTNSLEGIVTTTGANQSIGGLDAALQQAGYITGTVKAAGKPVAGVNVAAFDNSTDAEYDAQAPSSSTGAYSIKVPAGVPLEVETDGAPPYELQAWNGHNGCDCNYDPVTVTFGSTQSGIDFALLNEPLDIITLLFGDGGSGSPEPVPGGIVNLYRQVSGGYKLVDSETADGSGTAEFQVPTGGNMRLRISFTDPSDNKIHWLPIEGYEVINVDDPNSGNPVIPSNPVCFINLPGLQAGQQWGVVIEVIPDLTTCGPEPAIKKHTGTPPASYSGSTTGTSSDLASVTSTPTPTPTPTPTETTAPTQAPEPSASATPAPSPASSTVGLPWWIWLLIVVGVLVLVGIGVVIFRVRN